MSSEAPPESSGLQTSALKVLGNSRDILEQAKCITSSSDAIIMAAKIDGVIVGMNSPNSQEQRQGFGFHCKGERFSMKPVRRLELAEIYKGLDDERFADPEQFFFEVERRRVTCNSREILEQAKCDTSSSDSITMVSKIDGAIVDKDTSNTQERNQERRQGLGIHRKRPRFSMKPFTRLEPVEIYRDLDDKRFADPEQFFLEVERRQVGNNEIKRLSGQLDQDNPIKLREDSSNLPKGNVNADIRKRCPGILGRTVTYRHFVGENRDNIMDNLVAEVEALTSSQHEVSDLGFKGPVKGNLSIRSHEIEKIEDACSRATYKNETKSCSDSNIGNILESLLPSIDKLDDSELITSLRELLHLKEFKVETLRIPVTPDSLRKSPFIKRPYVAENRDIFGDPLSTEVEALTSTQPEVFDHGFKGIIQGNSSIRSEKVEKALVAYSHAREELLSVFENAANPESSSEDSEIPVEILSPVDVSSLPNDDSVAQTSPDLQKKSESPVIGQLEDFGEGPDGMFYPNGQRDSVDFSECATTCKDPLENVDLCRSDGKNMDMEMLSDTHQETEHISVEQEDESNSMAAATILTGDMGSGVPAGLENEELGNDFQVHHVRTSGGKVPHRRTNEKSSKRKTSLADGSNSMAAPTVLIGDIGSGMPVGLENEELHHVTSSRGKVPRGRLKEKSFKKKTNLADDGTNLALGLRRSTRNRTRPLEFWRGEKLLYGQIHDSFATVIGVKYSSPGGGDLKVKSYVSDEYADLVQRVSDH